MLSTKLQTVTAAVLTALVGIAAWRTGSALAVEEPAKGESPAKADNMQVLTPEDVMKQPPKESVTVEFTVKNIHFPLKPFVPGGKMTDRIDKRHFDLKDDHTFFARISGKAATQIYRLGIEPEAYFSGKVIRTTGQVLTFRNHTDEKIDYGIVVEGLDQLEVVKRQLNPPKKDAPAQAQLPVDIIGAGETAMELVKTTKDSDAKWMAIRILGSLRYERAIPLLLESLTDPHEYVRSNAARALGDMKVAAAAKPLIQLLEKETNGGVIQQTSLAMTRLHCTDSIPALKAAAKHEDVQTRMWVLQAIGGLGGKKDVRFLARFLLDDPSSSVQAFAAQAIEQITGADFGFPKRSGPSGPEEGIKRAKSWWAEHKGEFKDED